MSTDTKDFYLDLVFYNYHLFATRHKLVLPSEDELRRELIREQLLLEERAQNWAPGKKSTRIRKP